MNIFMNFQDVFKQCSVLVEIAFLQCCGAGIVFSLCIDSVLRQNAAPKPYKEEKRTKKIFATLFFDYK
jgi:hypothetical protein